MLLLASLVGMMAVGASAFIGFDTETDEEDEDVTSDVTTDEGAAESTQLPDMFLLLPEEEGDPPDAIGEPEETQETNGEIAWGDSEDDDIRGTSGSDQLNGYAGDDIVMGGDGNDHVYGDIGNDTLYGEDGDDHLHGGDDNDTLIGGDGADSLYGHNDDDSLAGGQGDDTLVGSAGNDQLDGGDGNDALHGDIGDDTLHGGLGADTLFGGWGNDVIDGTTDDPATVADDDIDTGDYLNGGGGDDLIIAGHDDIVTSGSGADTIAMSDWLTQEHQAEILDFSASEDNLMVIFDDTADPDPQVSLEQDEVDQDRQHLVFNGMRITSIANAEGLTLEHITLISESAFNNMTGA